MAQCYSPCARTVGNGQKFDIVRARAHDVSAAQIAVLNARARDGTQLLGRHTV